MKYRFEELIPGKRTPLSRKEPEKDLLRRQLALCIPEVVMEAETQMDDKLLGRVKKVLKIEGRETASRAVRYAITEMARSLIYPQVGNHISINDSDLLVTTPLDKADEHVAEADGLIDQFNATGEVGFYYRKYNPWGAPKTLGLGSKLLYVDQRAIRGFAVVTDFEVDRNSHELITMMNADTWKWIDPIYCDYDDVKPPQGYAYANRHRYLQDVDSLRIVSGWLDPMPKKPQG